MRILLILLALVAAPAWAEWVELGETDNATHYIDPAMIKKDGNLRKVWELQDLKQRHKDGEMSRRMLFEYDCKGERVRILSISEHSEPMAGGKLLFTGDRDSKWKYIPPGTAAANMLEIVCKK